MRMKAYPARAKAIGRLKKRLIPAVFAGITLSIMVLLLEYFKTDILYGIGINAVIFASFASSIYIMFIMPNSRAAKSSKFVKSYALAAVVGYLGGLTSSMLPLFAVAGMVIFVLTVLLILTYSEHPPAAAIAFAFVLFHVGITGMVIIAAGVAIVLLSRFVLEKKIFEIERKIEKKKSTKA